jgi:hypothetical protein
VPAQDKDKPIERSCYSLGLPTKNRPLSPIAIRRERERERHERSERVRERNEKERNGREREREMKEGEK